MWITLSQDSHSHAKIVPNILEASEISWSCFNKIAPWNSKRAFRGKRNRCKFYFTSIWMLVWKLKMLTWRVTIKYPFPKYVVLTYDNFFNTRGRVNKVKKIINKSQICLYIKIKVPFLLQLIVLLCLALLYVFARVKLRDPLAVWYQKKEKQNSQSLIWCLLSINHLSYFCLLGYLNFIPINAN